MEVSITLLKPRVHNISKGSEKYLYYELLLKLFKKAVMVALKTNKFRNLKKYQWH